jgi:hypothetical protein
MKLKYFLGLVGAGVKGALEVFEPGPFSAGGKRISCPHCGHETFDIQDKVFNSWSRELFTSELFSQTAAVLICTNCTHLQWFGERPERIYEK